MTKMRRSGNISYLKQCRSRQMIHFMRRNAFLFFLVTILLFSIYQSIEITHLNTQVRQSRESLETLRLDHDSAYKSLCDELYFT